MKKLFDNLMLSGIIIFIAGLYFWMIKAGLPYQDPTPEMSLNWTINSRVGQVLLLLGAAVIAISLILRILTKLIDKKS